MFVLFSIDINIIANFVTVYCIYMSNFFKIEKNIICFKVIGLVEISKEKYQEGKIMAVGEDERWQDNSTLIEKKFYLKIPRHAIIFD